MANVEEERVPLGRRLRQITDQANASKEAQALYDMLKEAASKGEDHLYFADLRTVVPNMILNDTLWAWLQQEEIRMSGAVNQSTAAYEYTLMW